jgi:phage tail sheath protein FI
MIHEQVPGVYIEPQKYVLNPLRIDKRCLTGFVGIAERGPLHTPVVIASFDEYIKTFGSFDTAGNLPYAVYSYFKCGGAECVVVRSANEKYAQKAELKLKCSGKGQVVFQARTEGAWGNYITANVRNEGDELAVAGEVDTERGEWVAVESEEELKTGDAVRLSLLGREAVRNVVKKEGSKIYFDKPVKQLMQIKDTEKKIKLEKVYVSVSLSRKEYRENFLHLSMNPASERYYVSYINERSRLCTVSSDKAHGVIEAVFAVSASGGREGIAEMSAGDLIGKYDGPERYRGLGALESRDDVSLIAIPDISWLYGQAGASEAEKEHAAFTVCKAMVEQAEKFPGRFAVLDAPGHLDSVKLLAWVKQFDTSFGAAYFPYIDILDPLDPRGISTVRLPPSGAVCGSIAAITGEKGIFHAPANTLLHGAVGLSARVTDGEHEMLYAAGINLLKYFPGRGIKVWGARTLSSDPNWKFINVRRTFSSICRSLKSGTQWAVFETNDKRLWKRIVREVSGFLLDLWLEGYLAGSQAEQGFFVRCDEELNPPENVDAGILTFSVGLAITKPTEFYKISLTAEKDGVSVYIKEE